MEIDQIKVADNGVIFYRKSSVADDGISRQFHRSSLVPGQDLTGQPEKVVAIAQAAWTPEVVAAYEASRAAV